MWVRFRSDWVRKGVTHVTGDVLEVEDWEAEQVIALGRAKACDAPPVEITEPSDVELLDAVMAEDEQEGPQFKAGSLPDEQPAVSPRTGRKFK